MTSRKTAFTGSRGHKLVHLRVLREPVDKRHQGGAVANQTAAGIGVGDVTELLLGNVQQLSQPHSVGRRLIEHDHELGVGEHGGSLNGIQQVLHVLRDGCRIGVPFTEHSPRRVKEVGAVLVGIQHVELVNEDMRPLATLPVQGSTVEDGIGDDQQAGGLELGSEIVNVEHQDALVQIYGGAAAEDVQRTGGKQFHCQGNVPCFLLRLLQKLFPKRRKRWHHAGLLRLVVNCFYTAVDQRLLLRADAAVVNLLQQGQNELALGDKRIAVGVTVALHHIHGVEPILAACGDTDNGAVVAHRFDHRSILAFGITDDDVVIGVQHQEHHELLCREGLAGTRNAQQDRGLVHKVGFIDHNQVVTYSVFSIVDAALVLNLLHLEGHEHRKALRGQRSEGINLADTDRKDRVQPVELLVLEYRHLAHVLADRGEQGLGIVIQLLLRIRRQHHRENADHHALIAAGQIVQKVLCLRPLLLHVIGNDGGEVVVGVLTALPIRDVGLDAEEPLLHLQHRLVHRNGHDVDGEHQIAVHFGDLGNHAVLDVAGVVLQVKDSGVAVPDLEIITVLFHAAGADGILEIVTFPHGVLQIESKRPCGVRLVEIMEHPQLRGGVHRFALRAEAGEVHREVCADTGKVIRCFLDVFLGDRDRDVLLLRDAVCADCLIQKHLVVLGTVDVPHVASHGHQHRAFKVVPAHMTVGDRNLGGRAAVQAVEQGGVGKEHLFLVLPAGNQVIDVGKAEGLAELVVADHKNAIRPDPLDGDQILHPARNGVAFLIGFQNRLNAFHHAFCIPPSPWQPAHP